MNHRYGMMALVALFAFMPFASVRAQLHVPIGITGTYSSSEDPVLQRVLRSGVDGTEREEAGRLIARATPPQATGTYNGMQYIGIAVGYGFDIETLALQASYNYFMTEVISLGGDLTFYFPETVEIPGVEIKTSFFVLNVLAHYYFLQNEGFNVYGLAGLQIAFIRVKSDITGIGSSSVSESELGIPIGGGVEYSLGAALLFGELRYGIGGDEQLAIYGGIRFPIGN